MMDINISNYEAFLLDYSEGHLNRAEIDALRSFLLLHPHLHEELDNLEIIQLHAVDNEVTEDWSSLKKKEVEGFETDVSARENLFLEALDGQLCEADQVLLNGLLAVPAFAKEFEDWNKTKLSPHTASTPDFTWLYRFGIEQEVSDHNFDSYLIALGEGLLSEEQTAALEVFAKSRSNGTSEMKAGRNLRLKPALGVFFPDKERLYQKEKKVFGIWMYRALAAVAAVFAIVALWSVMQTEPDLNQKQIAKKGSNPIRVDSLKKETVSPVESDTLREVAKPATTKVPLETWEVHEPDVLEYAENEAEKKVDPSPRMEIEKIPETMGDDGTEIALLPPLEIEKVEVKLPSADLKSVSNEKTAPKYLSVGQLAENKLADRLEISESERDALGLAVAKKLTEKASNLVNAEVSIEGNTLPDGGENLTYTLRLGSFQLKHVKSK